MSILLITFFISLVGIAGMIARKLLVSPASHSTDYIHNFAIDVPDLDEVRKITNKNVRKFSYVVLVITLRSYLLSLDLLKKQYRALINKIEEIKRNRKQKKGLPIPEAKEASKFLNMISEYKTKIKKIKKRIKEEEGLN